MTLNDVTFPDSVEDISLNDDDYYEEWDWTNILSNESVNPIDSQTSSKVQLDNTVVSLSVKSDNVCQVGY